MLITSRHLMLFDMRAITKLKEAGDFEILQKVSARSGRPDKKLAIAFVPYPISSDLSQKKKVLDPILFIVYVRKKIFQTMHITALEPLSMF